MDGTTTLNDFDFAVELLPLTTTSVNGDTIDVPTDMSRALVRTDTNGLLGVPGSK